MILALSGFQEGEQEPAREAFTTRIPGSTWELVMQPIPGTTTESGDPLEPFWLASRELTWDAFDAFVFEELAPSDDADALARPTKPYITADRGFGHEGWPVGSLSRKSAEAFCDWLEARVGGEWRLPTRVEWVHAALAGAPGPWHHGRKESGLEDVAWYKPNARRKTHPVGELAPNAFGLHDMHGNVAEWVTTDDGKGRLMGGSYLDPAPKITATSERVPSAGWNMSDPNLPKSPWWLADGPFAGFRVVCTTPPPPKASEEQR